MGITSIGGADELVSPQPGGGDESIARWEEKADDLHAAKETGPHANVYAVILALSDGEVLRNDGRAVSCRDDQFWNTAARNRLSVRGTFHRRTIDAVTAINRIPIMADCRR